MNTLRKQAQTTMEKLDPKRDSASPDIVAENIERMRELFPEVFTEGKIDFEALKETLGEYVEEKQERYSFTWHGKSRARRIAQTPSTGTLLPCPEESVDWDTTKNIFIEGDNLEVLKLLQKSYHRKVKMIYIDPPYNTGKEFIYPDKYQDNLDTYLRYTRQIDDAGFKISANSETSGRYHTNWLNMMYPRLKLARNLLRDDGVLFATIDDGEHANLRALLNEVFGEENFIANIVWQKKQSPQNDAINLSDMHDHILLYAKRAKISKDDETGWQRRLLNRTSEQDDRYSNPDNDPRGPWTSADYTCNKSADERPNLYYPIKNPVTNEDIYPSKNRVWGAEKKVTERNLAENRIWWGASGRSMPRLKKFRSEVQEGIVPSTWWDRNSVGDNQEAARELRALFSGDSGGFDTPKPTRLIRRMLEIATLPDEEAIVLDFFAGSGTTGQAVWDQNRADNGDRKFILVQLPEPTEVEGYITIAEISKARLRFAATPELKAIVNGATAGPAPFNSGFRVFKLASSNFLPWSADVENVEELFFNAIENIKPDRTEEDLLYELLLKYGLDLATQIDSRTIVGRKIYIIGAGALVVCLAKSITLEVVEGIAALKDEFNPEIMRVVFRDAGFTDDVVKTNTVQILKQAGINDVKSL